MQEPPRRTGDVMTNRLAGFCVLLFRWLALVALALVPTVIVVVAYRQLKGEPLWTMSDLPLAGEVTLCLAWLSILFATQDLLCIHAGVSSSLWTAIAASIIAAVPIGLGLSQIDELRRVLGHYPRNGGGILPAAARAAA